jgi:acetyl-CoA C-acetyltransferase
MKKVVIVSAVRTPLGKFGGALSSLNAVTLGILVAKEAVARAGISPDQIQEVIFGNARQAGNGPNPARQIGIGAGIPVDTPAYTVNQACASGMKSIILGYQAIVLGDADVVLCGGTESMSNTPFLFRKMRAGIRLGHAEVEDGMYRDGFMCPMAKMLMGETAEILAEKFKISREEQDEYAALSQQRCEIARKNGLFDEEIIPVEVQQSGPSVLSLDRIKTTLVTSDENPRDGVTAAALNKLPPAFKKNGTVHPGNSSGITDGAAAIILMSEEKAAELKTPILARIENYAVTGVDPTLMGLGPIKAVRLLEKRAGVSALEVDLIELGEAFAVQVLACNQELKLDRAKLNVKGGFIPLGHPIGCSGARIIVTLVHEMKRRKALTGLAALCVSGGMGAALMLRLN